MLEIRTQVKHGDRQGKVLDTIFRAQSNCEGKFIIAELIQFDDGEREILERFVYGPECKYNPYHATIPYEDKEHIVLEMIRLHWFYDSINQAPFFLRQTV